MKRMKVVIIPERKEEHIDFIACDLCGNKAPNPVFEGDWTDTDIYETKTVKIQFKEGYGDTEGGWVKKIKYHVCPRCFLSKLGLWFKEQGATATVYENRY